MSLLFAVRDFLRGQGAATASQIAGSLQLPRATVEDALVHWQRRGQIEVLDSEMSGGSCAPNKGSQSGGCGGGSCGGGGCGTSTTGRGAIIYRWHATG